MITIETVLHAYLWGLVLLFICTLYYELEDRSMLGTTRRACAWTALIYGILWPLIIVSMIVKCLEHLTNGEQHE